MKTSLLKGIVPYYWKIFVLSRTYFICESSSEQGVPSGIRHAGSISSRGMSAKALRAMRGWG
ncbi:MAG: hypothetical protein J5855_05120, partial [Mailhella sp.]|nr:hypothetical protein [Mailhella sp.]